jgi:hypothetical protein
MSHRKSYVRETRINKEDQLHLFSFDMTSPSTHPLSVQLLFLLAVGQVELCLHYVEENGTYEVVQAEGPNSS